MPRTPLPFTNGFYQSPSLPFSAQRCMNWFPHFAERPALTEAALFGAPGIDVVASASDSALAASRGAHVMNGIPYFVLGQALYKLTAEQQLENLGTIDGVGRCSMDDNGKELVVLVPGAKGYIYTETPQMITEITDTNFRANGNPLYVTFVDGYFVYTTDQNKFIISGLNDGLTYAALDRGTAESSPDGVVTPLKYNNQLFIGGEHTAEGFQNVPNGADFPFQRNGLYLQQGIIAPFSAITCGKNTVFIGASKDESPAVWSFAGNATEKLSTDAIDSVLAGLSRHQQERISAWYYGDSGHYFVGFTLPTTTLVYDFATGIWSERQSRVPFTGSDYEITASRAVDYVSAYGKLYVADRQDGRIGVVRRDRFTEYGNLIPREAILQPFQNNMMSFVVPELELTVEAGAGNDLVVDPQIRLAISRDGGKTWGQERSRSIGMRGHRRKRTVWRMNGRSQRTDVYRLRMTDPANPTILQLTGNILANAAA